MLLQSYTCGIRSDFDAFQKGSDLGLLAKLTRVRRMKSVVRKLCPWGWGGGRRANRLHVHCVIGREVDLSRAAGKNKLSGLVSTTQEF